MIGEEFLAAGSLGFLFLFLFQLVDYLVDYFHALLGRHGGQTQQGVLQVHVLRIHGELVEHVAAPFQQVVVRIIFRQQGNGLGIAGLGQLILAALKIQFAECQLADGLVDAVTCRFFGGENIIFDGLGGVFARKVQVADGIVYLVEVFLVAVIAHHPAQCFNLGFYVRTGVDLALLYTGVEFGSVGCRRRAAGGFEGFVGRCFVAEPRIDLTQQETQASLLCA